MPITIREHIDTISKPDINKFQTYSEKHNGILHSDSGLERRQLKSFVCFNQSDPTKHIVYQIRLNASLLLVYLSLSYCIHYLQTCILKICIVYNN